MNSDPVIVPVNWLQAQHEPFNAEVTEFVDTGVNNSDNDRRAEQQHARGE
jgi:hypothetical protein